MSFSSDHLKSFIQSLNDVTFSFKNEDIPLNNYLEATVELLSILKREGGRLYFIGNGASSSIASHFANDFTKTCKIPSYTLHENSLLTCFSNDYSFQESFSEMLKIYLNPKDILVCISSSGKSKNIIEAAITAQKKSCKILTFTGFNSLNTLKNYGTLNLFVPSKEYGIVESTHSYYAHLVLDSFVHKNSDGF